MISHQDREVLRELLLRESPSTLLQILSEEATKESARTAALQMAASNRLNSTLYAQLGCEVTRLSRTGALFGTLSGAAVRIENLRRVLGIPPPTSDGAVQMAFL